MDLIMPHVTIGGDVKTANVVKLVEKYFGSIPKCPEVKAVLLPPFSWKVTAMLLTPTIMHVSLCWLIVYPTVPNYNKDMAALAMPGAVAWTGKNISIIPATDKEAKGLPGKCIQSL